MIATTSGTANIRIQDSMQELSENPTVNLVVSDLSIELSIKDIASLKKMLTESEQMLILRKKKFFESNNLSLF